MAVVKKTRTNKKKKIISYEAEVFHLGVRVARKNFKIKTEAHIWHDQMKQNFLDPDKYRRSEQQNATFAKVVEAYKQEALPMLRKSTQQTHLLRLFYLDSPSLNNVKMVDFCTDSIDAWLNWLRKHPTAQNPSRKSFTILPWRSTHILRHSFATNALIATRDMGAVQACLGHDNEAMAKRYAKIVALLDQKTVEETSARLQMI